MAAKKGNKYAKGNKGGRPRKIEIKELPKFGEEMLFWFEQKLDYLKKNFRKKSFYVDVPFFEDFVKELGNISYRTINDYSEQSKEFSQSWSRCKDVQKRYIIFCGQNNLSNPSFSIFTAKNLTDMRDKNEIEHSGKIGTEINNLPEVIEAVKEYEKIREKQIKEESKKME